MLKLYKRIKRVLHYHEAWAYGAKIIEHWGIVGERGKTAEHKRLGAGKGSRWCPGRG